MTIDPQSEDKQSILVVEDDNTLAELYSLWLSDKHQVTIATDSTEAIEYLDEKPDIVLLDRKLPSHFGEYILQELRDQNLNCMVAMISAESSEVDIAKFQIDDYITKPVNEKQIRRAVDDLILRLGVDSTKRELLALISRRSALEVEHPPVKLHENREYKELTREIKFLSDELDASPQNISSNYRPDSCPDCGFRWDISLDGVVGFVPLASRTWKCSECGEIVEDFNPQNRHVARK